MLKLLLKVCLQLLLACVLQLSQSFACDRRMVGHNILSRARSIIFSSMWWIHSSNGYTISLPLVLELRATYVLGRYVMLVHRTTSFFWLDVASIFWPSFFYEFPHVCVYVVGFSCDSYNVFRLLDNILIVDVCVCIFSLRVVAGPPMVTVSRRHQRQPCLSLVDMLWWCWNIAASWVTVVDEVGWRIRILG